MFFCYLWLITIVVVGGMVKHIVSQKGCLITELRRQLKEMTAGTRLQVIICKSSSKELNANYFLCYV